MGVKLDSRGAFKGGARFAGMADRMAKAEKLAAISLHRAIVPETVRDMQGTHNLNAARIRASLAARVDGTTVELRGLDRPTGLTQYGAKASKRNGVTVTVVKASGPVRLRHAFKATGRGSNEQVFQRAGKPRLPIKTLYGPSVAQILRDPARQKRLVQFSMTKLSAEIRRQLGRL